MGLIIVMEFSVSNCWNHLCLECDSSTDAHAFKNHSVIPVRLRNR